jgi:hypothetical protein
LDESEGDGQVCIERKEKQASVVSEFFVVVVLLVLLGLLLFVVVVVIDIPSVVSRVVGFVDVG